MGRRYLLVGMLLAVSLAQNPGYSVRITRVGARPAPALGPLPQRCPTGPPPTKLGPVFGSGPGVSGYGAFPIWALGFDGPHATLRYSSNAADKNLVFVAPYGWGHKMLWLVTPRYKGRVTLRGGSLQGNRPLYFDTAGQQEPTTSPVFDATHPFIRPHARGEWPEFNSSLYVPQAGCYYVDVHWSGGTWRMVFAAGQSRRQGR